MAKKKLKDFEEFFIRNNPQNLSVDALAEKFECSTQLVERLIEDERVKREAEKQKNTKKEPTIMSKLIGKKIRNGKPVAVVMTPAASELSDAVRPKVDGSIKNSKTIHKPFGEDY